MAFKSVFVAVICVAIGVALAYPQATQTKTDDKKDTKESKDMKGAFFMKCAGADVKMPNATTLAAMETCHAKPNATLTATSSTSNSTSGSGSTSGQSMPSKDQYCKMTICSLQKLGIADSKGMPVKANITAQLQAMAPAAKLTDITTAVNGCLDKHTSKLDMTKCDTYEDLFKCVHTDVGKICDWKDDMP